MKKYIIAACFAAAVGLLLGLWLHQAIGMLGGVLTFIVVVWVVANAPGRNAWDNLPGEDIELNQAPPDQPEVVASDATTAVPLLTAYKSRETDPADPTRVIQIELCNTLDPDLRITVLQPCGMDGVINAVIHEVRGGRWQLKKCEMVGKGTVGSTYVASDVEALLEKIARNRPPYLDWLEVHMPTIKVAVTTLRGTDVPEATLALAVDRDAGDVHTTYEDTTALLAKLDTEASS